MMKFNIVSWLSVVVNLCAIFIGISLFFPEAEMFEHLPEPYQRMSMMFIFLIYGEVLLISDKLRDQDR